uniref:Uncharacterized protein n=1 Tax=Arundo donax TaxID=35708 RepID=A0A0A9I084_ARUDO
MQLADHHAFALRVRARRIVCASMQ